MNQDTYSAWQEARQMWLDRQTVNTRRCYDLGLRQLMIFTGMQPWEIGRREIGLWMGQLRKTCSNGTITTRLSAVSSFYRFINDEYSTVGPNGEQITLRDDNPAAGGTRPRVSVYGKAFALDKVQARALLKAINRETVIGKRDYALMIGYLMTGRRNTELRTLRYEDIYLAPEGTKFKWSGKGKTNQIADLNPPVMEAIEDYAAVEDRKVGFIFHSYTSRGEIVERPVSSGYVRRALKYYAAKAGLNASRIKVHTLRHTAAVLRNDAGDDPEVIREYLGHASLATTQIYLQRLETRQDNSWQTVAEYLGLPVKS